MSKSLNLHKKLKGKVEITPKIKVTKNNFGLLYNPGVAEAAREIAKDPKKSFEYTGRGNNVAIITDGSRTIGVGDTIPEASLPIMEGKALFLKLLGGVNAYPFCLNTKSKEEIIRTIEILSPNFAAFNLEDVRACKSLEIMDELRKKDFIVFHDDEQGVAIVTLSALLNALRVVNKNLKKIKITIGGAGAAGYGIFKILQYVNVSNVVVFDANGIIFKGRKGDNKYVQELAKLNKEKLKGGKNEAITGADVFIGVTGVGKLLSSEDIKLMNERPIIYALSNPLPEITPKEIEKTTKNYIFASGRSDFENQINNIIVFPGVFRGLLDSKKKMSMDLELVIAKAIANLIKKPNAKNIIPSPFDKRLLKTIVSCIKKHKTK